MEHYHVLCLFSKHSNKWFIHWDNDHVPLHGKPNKYKVLVRMLGKMDGKCKELDLEKDGEWDPKCVFAIKTIRDIISVEGEPSASFLMG